MGEVVWASVVYIWGGLRQYSVVCLGEVMYEYRVMADVYVSTSRKLTNMFVLGWLQPGKLCLIIGHNKKYSP